MFRRIGQRAIAIIRRNRRRIAFVLTGWLLLLVYSAWPASSTFTISPETTFVTAPVDQFGRVDYVAFLNDRLRAGIKPEENANVLICEALGPHPNGTNVPAAYFQWLGMQRPLESGEYFLSCEQYQKDHSNRPAVSADKMSFHDRLMWFIRSPERKRAEPEVKDWLARNEKALQRLAKAVRRPAYYNPLVPTIDDEWSDGLVNAESPVVRSSAEIGMAFGARAVIRFGENKFVEMWQDLLACHRLGRQIARGGSLIESSLGFALEKAAVAGMLVTLNQSELTSAQILAWRTELQQLPAMPAIADKMDQWGRYRILNSIMAEAHNWRYRDSLMMDGPRPERKDLWPDLFSTNVKWDSAFRNANRWCDRCVTAMRLADRAARDREIRSIRKQIEILRLQLSEMDSFETLLTGPSRRGELLGNVHIRLRLPDLEQIQADTDDWQQEHRNLFVAFALAAHRADTGTYPSKLGDLVPKYIDSIPTDLYSGKALIYRLEKSGCVLYSVGPNGIDDGGREATDDIVVRLTLPPKQVPKRG
jgi:hypothetical protein